MSLEANTSPVPLRRVASQLSAVFNFESRYILLKFRTLVRATLSSCAFGFLPSPSLGCEVTRGHLGRFKQQSASANLKAFSAALNAGGELVCDI